MNLVSETEIAADIYRLYFAVSRYWQGVLK